MSVTLTLDIFSGRPNPTVELDGQQADDLLARLEPGRVLADDDKDLPESMPLGYRGIEVKITETAATGLRAMPAVPRSFRVAGGDLFGRGLAHKASDEGVEAFLLAADGPFARAGVEPELLQALPRLAEDFAKRRIDLIRSPIVSIRLREESQHAPLPDLSWWNAPSRKPCNNCYNYGSNYRTDTFAQPGRGSGEMYHDVTGPQVLAAAVRDQLIDSPDADNRFPAEGHLVALVIAPDPDFNDFHWYRKGRSGNWAHKPGPTAATDLDNAGNPITDPRTADRGPYTQFTTFMVVLQGHIKLA